MDTSTIVALSSGALPSGVAIIRLSGPESLVAVERLCGAIPAPKSLSLRTLKDPQTGLLLDRGLVAVFPGPASFTGEDCAELQVHGSRAGIKAILEVLTRDSTIRLANAGEFTRRAFENGKLDLTAIEGLGDLLAAETERQRRQALHRLEGGLTTKIMTWRAALIDLRAEIEAHLDFSDEDDVPADLPPDFVGQMKDLERDLSDTAQGYEAGRIVREGLKIVLAGAPNAGKSSLLNALAGSDLAIVTDQAGTTRDTKEVSIAIGGQLVTLTDTAGLRESDDVVEIEGIRRAHQAIEAADLIFWLVAPDAPGHAVPASANAPIWTIATKSDLSTPVAPTDLTISVKTRDGIEDLILKLKAHIETTLAQDEVALVSHLRDQEAINGAAALVADARAQIDRPEVCADLLRQAGDRLGQLTGLIDSEMVLDRLFAGFCIGK